MEIVIRFLQENPVQFLATIGMDGKPRVRPFKFRLESDDRLWFCTSNRKDVYKELIHHPSVELTTASPEEAWIRVSGDAVFENNLSIKQKMRSRHRHHRGLFRFASQKILSLNRKRSPCRITPPLCGTPLHISCTHFSPPFRKIRATK